MQKVQEGRTSQGTDPAVLRVAALLEQKVDDVAASMVEAYRARIPSYADAAAEHLAEIREWGRGSVLVATGIVTGKVDASEFSEALTDVGRARAEQGFPLHDVLLANLIGTEVLWKAVAELEPEDAEARVKIRDVFMEASVWLLQQAVTALSTGYLEVEEARVADTEHDMQTLVETLAGLRTPDRRHAERAEMRGIDLATLKWCAIALVDGDTGALVRSMRRLTAGAAVGRIGRRVIAFLPGDQPPETGDVPTGISSAEDLAVAYRRAMAALQVAVHLNRNGVIYEEVVPLAMVLSGPQDDRDAFINAQLGPLLEDTLGDELLRSLEAYYRAGMSVAAAARDLYVHRHTLEYRLSRIETALETDIRSPDRRMLLELALALRTDGS